MPLRVWKGDITTLQVDAIVNAANRSLLGGGGVDGAIHHAAGSELLAECRTLNGCETGQSKLTKGYCLPAKYVIHTVGPVWHGGSNGEAELLRSCYSTVLQICQNQNLLSVAFPAIGTGVYGYPKIEAAKIAIETVNGFIQCSDIILDVIFCVFDDESFNIYSDLLESNRL